MKSLLTVTNLIVIVGCLAALYFSYSYYQQANKDQFDVLMDWIRSNGGTVQDLMVKDLGGGERGVFARTTLKQGNILSVPTELVFSSNKALNDPVIGPALKEAYEELQLDRAAKDRIVNGFKILYEKYVVGSKSFWKPYIDSLPSEDVVFASCVFATDEEMKQTAFYPPLERDGIVHRHAISLMPEIVAKNPTLFPAEHFTTKRLRWAYYMVLSRAWNMPERLDMLPLGDMLNHSPYSITKIDIKEKESIFFIDGGNTFKAGEEVTDSYNRRPTALMTFNLWGFVPSLDQCFFALHHPVDIQFSQAHVDLLAKNGCINPRNELVSFTPCSGDSLFKPFNSIMCYRLAVLSESQLKAINDANEPPERYLSRLGSKLDKQAIELALKLATAQRETFLTKIEDDVALMESGSLTSIEKAIVNVRVTDMK